MSEALKPCMLCGHPAVGPDNITRHQGFKDPRWKIGCGIFCVSIVRHTKKEAIKDWNFRPGEKEARVEAL